MNKNALLEMLAGEWTGAGIGLYPTIEPFEYLETLRFALDEKGANLHYEQKTRRRNIGQSDYVWIPLGKWIPAPAWRTTKSKSLMSRSAAGLKYLPAQ